MNISDTIWGFDYGKASLGEAVRSNLNFLHVESLIIPPDFAEIKTAAALRSQKNIRASHKTREKFLESCLKDCDIEVLQRRKVGIVNGKWALIQKGDKRLEQEFPNANESICYNSIALRCKLLLGEKLESWQVFKALNSAIQKRGYDENLPWKESESKTSNKNDEDDYQKSLQVFEKEKAELLAPLDDWQEYDYPCFLKAYKMGIWNPKNPKNVEIRTTHTAQKAKGYVIPRKYVEKEFVRLVEMASLQYPKLADKALFILYGYSETAYASYNPQLRKEFNLKRGALSDLTALGQKIPRFDNRIIEKCVLIPRFNVCKIKPLADITNDADLLHYEITLAFKLLNLRFYRGNAICGFSFNEFLEIFELAKSKKYKLTKTDIAKFFKKINASSIDDNNSLVEAPRESGRAKYSRPAMSILKELIFSGKSPKEYYAEKIKTISNQNKNKGLVAEDLDFVKLMGDVEWNKIYIPDVQSYKFAEAQSKNLNVDELINKLIGKQNDPIVRHRLTFFYERIKALHKKFGVPQKVILEFVRDDFLGEKRKKELHQQMKNRQKEKLNIAKKLDELSEKLSDSQEDIKYKGGKMLLKMELLEKQKGQCVYTGDALEPTDLKNLEIEHIVPRSKGGPDSIYNYVLTTESTNKEKGNRTPYEWLSTNPEKWKKYSDRVRSLTASLGKKRCSLLLSEDAEKLVEKYTGLAETAWIAKLAQKILCLYFGFQIGSNEGEKRVFTVSGNTTSLIRSSYKLNKLLHKEEVDRESMSEVDYILKVEELDKKNRDNKKHHALDAMCLTFAPVGKDMRKVKMNEILPKEIAKNVENFFGKYLENLVPNEVAVEKPRLEDSIYAKKKVDGKFVMTKRFLLEELAYKNVGVNKKAYDLKSLQKNLDDIISPQIKEIVKAFAQTNPNESEWLDWCKNVKIPSKFGEGSSILKVQMKVGDPAEYKDLSKDSCGAYRKGDSHKGQIIWKNRKGKYIVAPIYAHSSKFNVLNELKLREDFESIVGEFRKHCLVKIENPVFNSKNEQVLSQGIYMVNTIWTDGHIVFTDPNGETTKPINIQKVVEAGMKRIRLEY